MASLSSDAAAAKRTFANVAASASTTAQFPVPYTSDSISDESGPGNGKVSSGPKPQLPITHETLRISPAIPKKLAHAAPNPQQPTVTGIAIAPRLQVQNPTVDTDNSILLSAPLPSGVSDENSTLLSSSDSSAKPPSLDGKSVASATTFAMDEKESLRPDDSASVKAVDDEDVYSAHESAVVGSRVGSETGARAFQDQLQEITSMGGSARPPMPTSRPGSRSTPNEGLLYNPSIPVVPGQLPGFAQLPGNTALKMNDFPPDQKLLEAISNPRDRIWVLKLEQDIIDFVKDSKEPYVDLPQCNSFYRMLAHKLADYYLLGHAVDSSVTAVRLYRTPTCRIAPPLTALTNPSTASNTPPPSAPQVKILRRGGEAPVSKASSETGDSDGDKNKAPLTREEREQRYEQARLRIMGSAKPEAESVVPKEKDESRSSSAAGKKKPKKQRTNSEDGFEARSAYSTYNPAAPYTQSGAHESSGAPGYYAAYGENGAGMHNASGGYAPQTYNAVYGGQTMPSQAPYPWLQQGYSNYTDASGQHWDQSNQNGNELAADFQQAMSFQTPNMHGPPSASSPATSFGFANQQQTTQQGQQQQQQQQVQVQQSWPQGMPYQPNYAMGQGYPPYGQSERPTSSASHGSQYNYGMPGNHMPSQFQGYGNATMNGGFRPPSFNPQSQAFIPGFQTTSGPPMYMSGMPGPQAGYNGYGSAHGLQRQNSTHSQGSSYSGQRSNNDSVNGRGGNTGMTHPLPQPVFSPSVSIAFPGAKVQQQSTGSRNVSGNGANERVSVGGGGPSASSIAKWGTPASLPAKPPPPANESFDMGRLQGQRAPGFNTAAAARLPGMGAPGYHGLGPITGTRGGQAGQSPRGGGQ